MRGILCLTFTNLNSMTFKIDICNDTSRYSPSITLNLRNIFLIYIQGNFSWAREKGKDLTQSYDKSPYTHRKSKKQRDNIKNATRNFNYTTTFLVSQSAMLKEWSVQGCNRAKHKTYSPLHDHWVMLTAFHYFGARRDEIRFVFDPA